MGLSTCSSCYCVTKCENKMNNKQGDTIATLYFFAVTKWHNPSWNLFNKNNLYATYPLSKICAFFSTKDLPQHLLVAHRAFGVPTKGFLLTIIIFQYVVLLIDIVKFFGLNRT